MNIKTYIPSALTLGNLFCGFVALILADYYYSSLMLLFCLLFDVLDGYVARLLKAQSEFGKELDSLADMVSFGLVPAYLYYMINPLPERFCFLPSAFLVLGAAVRLAKFNLTPSTKYFYGLPTPSMAIFLLGLFLAHHHENQYIMAFFDNQIAYALTPMVLAFLMLSRIKMFSLKGLNNKILKNKFHIAMLVIMILLVLFDNKLAISLSVVVYILLSLIYTVTVKE